MCAHLPEDKEGILICTFYDNMHTNLYNLMMSCITPRSDISFTFFPFLICLLVVSAATYCNLIGQKVSNNYAPIKSASGRKLNILLKNAVRFSLGGVYVTLGILQ